MKELNALAMIKYKTKMSGMTTRVNVAATMVVRTRVLKACRS